MVSAANERFEVLDCRISRTNISHALQAVLDRIASRQGGYICFSNVHTVVSARKDLRLRDITNNSFLSMPDGKPLSIVAKWKGIADAGRVAGPDFMPYFIQAAKEVRHFFFGSTHETLEKLVENLKKQFPDIVIAGYYSPPYGAVPDEAMKEIISVIHQAKPDIVWVGLGAPKQEYWMAKHWQQLKPAVLMGVGAAFDFHAGKVPRAPEWMRKMSIEWFYRVYQEPRRLWKRYLYTNLLFFYYLMTDFLFQRQIRSSRIK